MPFDTNYTHKNNGLAAQAIAAQAKSRENSQIDAAGVDASLSPRHGNTGGTLRQSHKNKPFSEENGEVALSNIVTSSEALPQTTPPRKSRAKQTADPMGDFVATWFFDWLSVTIPNSTDGKGSKSEGILGDRESKEAAKRLFSFVTLNDLRLARIGKGTDGYAAGANFAFDPMAKERVATIRDGHKTNMPNIELTGGDGACAELAPLALEQLGPVLLARADVSRDISQEGLFDELHELCCEFADARSMDQPRVDGTVEAGRTIYFGKGENSVKIYEKDLERVARKKKDIGDADLDLVRVEFTFRPGKPGVKAGLGRVAREHGAGALLGSSNWVRCFVERLAVMTEAAREEEAELAVTRVERRPDPRTMIEKAEHGLQQYARTFCRAEISREVCERFDGDYLQAMVDPKDVLDRVMNFVEQHIEEVAHEVCDDYGVQFVSDHEEEAARAKIALDAFMDRQKRETDQAQCALARAEYESRLRAGVTA